MSLEINNDTIAHSPKRNNEIVLIVRQVELIRLVEHLCHLVDFKEGGTGWVAHAKAATKVSDLIIKRDISFLSEHSECCSEHELW